VTGPAEKDRGGRSTVRRVHSSERGQVLISAYVALAVMIFGVAGFVIDVGRLYVSYHQLLASTDAAALAGGEALAYSTENAIQVATQYSSTTTTGANAAAGTNPHGAMSNLQITVTPVCLTTVTNAPFNIPCVGDGQYNAIRVTQTATLPMTLAKFFGTSSLPLSVTATASMAGVPTVPFNIAIILDATLSQASLDDDCGSGVTEMQCELDGVQVLLQELWPCTGGGNCNISNGVASNSFDRVALFTFPGLSTSTAAVDSGCTSPITAAGASKYGYGYSSSFGYYSMLPQTAWPTIPSAVPYSFPAIGASSYAPTSSTGTYQITPFLSDYRTSDTATTLNTGSGTPVSLLSNALGAVSGCGSMAPPNYDGDYGTYYAGVIYAAQAALVAEQAAYPGSQNILMLLSDGNATAPQQNGSSVYPMPSPATNKGTYPSWVNECHQAVTAGQYAASQGTRVYSIAYGSESSGCASDSPNISPCYTMQNIASSPSYFYSDYTQSGSGIDQNCVGTGATTTNLKQIFVNIYSTLAAARLIPNGMS
jgi:hypothetical protein